MAPGSWISGSPQCIIVVLQLAMFQRYSLRRR